MQLANALSRSLASQEIKLDMRVDYICLHEAMDRETEGQHSKRPHPSNGVSAHTTRLANIKEDTYHV